MKREKQMKIKTETVYFDFHAVFEHIPKDVDSVSL